jgi:hypothetical protein
MLSDEERLALLRDGLGHLKSTKEGYDRFLSTGRGSEWRAALKSLDELEDDLMKAIATAAEESSSGDGELARRIDRFIDEGTWKIRGDARYSDTCPLAGFGATFVRAGRKHGVDPRFLVAIATHENRLGTFKAIQSKHNTFGLGPGRSYKSWEANIEAAARNLSRPDGFYVGKNTIRSIGSTWAPVGATNDPNDVNQHWIGSVTQFYATLGGRRNQNAVVKTRP